MEKNSVQVGLLCLVLGVVGMGVFHDYEGTKVPTIHVVSATSPLNSKMASALSKRSLADHEKLYKLYSGLSEYTQNANRLNTTVDAYKAVAEVMLVYDMKGNFPEVADLVDEQLSPIKTPAKLVDKKDEVIRLFRELAEAVKYSADNLPKDKK